MKLTTTSFLSCFLLAATFGLTGCPAGGGESETDTNGSSGSSSTATPTGGEALDCDSYCTDNLANCTATNQQYTTMESCMGACAAFPVGAMADTMGNTLGCRTYHTGAAKDAPETHCVHAGPGGAGACGSNCDGFCSIAVATCSTEYPDMASCMTACAAFTDDVPYSTASSSGNSLACRLYHLSVAASDATSAATHCPHTAAASTPCM